MKDIGQAAKSVRHTLGLTQAKLAELLGITTVYISNIENGQATPSHELIARYEKLCGVNIYAMQWLYNAAKQDQYEPKLAADALSIIRNQNYKIKLNSNS
jgi:transcriptional regulator with XRE-family HTH domain